MYFVECFVRMLLEHFLISTFNMTKYFPSFQWRKCAAKVIQNIFTGNKKVRWTDFVMFDIVENTRGWKDQHMCSWIKRDQLNVSCFIISLFNAQHISDVNTSILRNLRLICWVISWVVLLWFDVCWCYVVVRLWWCGIRMQAEACIRIPHHHSQTTT